HEDVPLARAGDGPCAEIDRPLELPHYHHVAAAVHRHPVGDVVARASEAPGPLEGSRRGILRDKDVRTTRAREAAPAAVHRALERPRDHLVPAAVRRDRLPRIAPRAAEPFY